MTILMQGDLQSEVVLHLGVHRSKIDICVPQGVQKTVIDADVLGLRHIRERYADAFSLECDLVGLHVTKQYVHQ